VRASAPRVYTLAGSSADVYQGLEAGSHPIREASRIRPAASRARSRMMRHGTIARARSARSIPRTVLGAWCRAIPLAPTADRTRSRPPRQRATRTISAVRLSTGANPCHLAHEDEHREPTAARRRKRSSVRAHRSHRGAARSPTPRSGATQATVCRSFIAARLPCQRCHTQHRPRPPHAAGVGPDRAGAPMPLRGEPERPSRRCALGLLVC